MYVLRMYVDNCTPHEVRILRLTSVTMWLFRFLVARKNIYVHIYTYTCTLSYVQYMSGAVSTDNSECLAMRATDATATATNSTKV